MLLPAQVIPFLQHEDAEVRAHASKYLAKAHDPSPATADDFWRAIDRFGVERSIPLLADLRDIPQTESSYARAMECLRSGPGEDANYHLQQVFSWLDLPVLLARRDELLTAEQLPPDVREHLRQRIELSDQPLDELWAALERHSAEVDQEYWDNFDLQVSERLVEAVARHGETGALRALERLRHGPRDDYMEIFCVQVLGALRHEPASDVLIDRLLIDADVLRQEVVAALARIGTVDVVSRLEAFYPGKEWHVRLYADDPLGRIKRPQSEAALLRLLAGETDDELRTFLAMELCDLCTTEGLDAVRRLVVEDAYDSSVVELDELFLTVCTMTGSEPAEGYELRKRVERRRRKREKLLAEPGRMQDALRGLRDRLSRGEPIWPEPDSADDDTLPTPGRDSASMGRDEEDYSAPPGAATYRRDAPKTGRNDPCPCGSGKKYKKCCLKSAQA